MRQHPQLAASVLSQGDRVPETVTKIIAEHHEFQDGTGFPKLVKAGAVSSLAQLLALADAYDDLVTTRYGRPPLLPHDAIRQLFVLGAKGDTTRTWLRSRSKCWASILSGVSSNSIPTNAPW